MSRYLITTGDESTWKFDRPVVFLGKWCLKEGRREVWQALDYSVIDPDSIDHALPDLYQQTQLLHSHLSVDLASALNSFHDLNFSNRFWRVITGPWLRSFCDNFIFRWAYMNQAINEFHANESYSDFDDADPVGHPRNFLEYRSSQKCQDWNQIIFSKMWHLMSNSELPSHPVGPPSELSSPRKNLAEPKNSMSVRRVVMTDTYLPRTSAAMLSILMRSRPANSRRIAPPQATYDARSRSQLRFPSAPKSRLHAIAREMVRDQILTAYVEGFSALINSVRRLRLPDTPRLIFTSNRHLYDDVFNTWVALATENGSKYFIGQHGGHYGLSKFPSFSELHEDDISDVYLTWGWKNTVKQVPGPCLKTIGMKYHPSAKPTHLLIVCDPLWKFPRSLFQDLTEHTGYLEYVASCVTGLPAKIQQDVLIRLNHAHADTGSSQLEWWGEHAPTIAVDDGVGGMRKIAGDSRLVVSTNNGSTFLETLNLNIPTLITWDESYAQLRPEAHAYLKRLEEVGIFHASQKSFIDHVTKHWDDIGTCGKANQCRRPDKCFATNTLEGNHIP
ncbi:MAG: LIC12162 family protein [Ilumatobacteraceae bacterium]